MAPPFRKNCLPSVGKPVSPVVGLGEDREIAPFLSFFSPKRPQIAWIDMPSFMDSVLLVGSGRRWGRGGINVPLDIT